MITGIVRERRGGVRDGPPSGGGAARTVLACRAASHYEGVRNPSAPCLRDSPPSGTPEGRAERLSLRGPGRSRDARTIP